MDKIVHVQTVLLEKTVKELKDKTNKQITKDALTAAVDHFLTCDKNIDALRDALREARDYIAVQNMGSANTAATEILKRINAVI